MATGIRRSAMKRCFASRWPAISGAENQPVNLAQLVARGWSGARPRSGVGLCMSRSQRPWGLWEQPVKGSSLSSRRREYLRSRGVYVAGASTQSKRRTRRTLVLDAFPCHPQAGFVQERSSSPNILIASCSESDMLLHFLCRLML
jgi:hypothetical protein